MLRKESSGREETQSVWSSFSGPFSLGVGQCCATQGCCAEASVEEYAPTEWNFAFATNLPPEEDTTLEPPLPKAAAVKAVSSRPAEIETAEPEQGGSQGWSEQQKPGGPESAGSAALGMSFADQCLDVGWLNFTLGVVWPQARQFIIRKGTEKMLDAVHTAASDLPEFTIDDVSLLFDPGSVPPRITSLRPSSRNLSGIPAMQVDADVVWTSGPEFCIKPKLKGHGPAGVPIDISSISVVGVEVRGTASCMFAPLMSFEPLFGNLQLFCIDLPSLQIEIANDMKLFDFLRRQIVNMLKKTIVQVIQDNFVLPNRALMRTRPDVPLETLLEVKSPLPIGVLEIEVVEAKDLLASDTHVTGKPSSDPFVEIRIGNGMIRTSTVMRNTSPKWTDGPDYLLVYDMTQMVRIDIFDDDVWTEDDSLGFVPGFNVYWLCKELEKDPDGVWLQVTHPDEVNNPRESAGHVKLRGRYLGIGQLDEQLDLATPEGSRPMLVTVKLLGMEGSKASILTGAKAMVEWFPTGRGRKGSLSRLDVDVATPRSQTKSKAGRLWNATAGILSKTAGLAGRTAEKIKSVTGLGYGQRVEGIVKSKTSGSAFAWQVDIAQSMNAPTMKMEPTLVRVIEHLHHREGWGVERIGDMVGLDKDAVATAAAMRGNFGVVWHEAFHFLCPPNNSPLNGTVRITVKMPQRFKKMADSFGGLLNSSGVVGSVQLNLNHEPVNPDTTVQRRVRARIRRNVTGGRHRPEDDMKMSSRSSSQRHPTVASAAGYRSMRPQVAAAAAVAAGIPHESLRGDAQCEAIGDPVEGVLLEFLVEIRSLTEAEVSQFLQDGQIPGRRASLVDKYWRANSYGL
eukprot:CAMPEP_0178381172 /NCGR_PEP_ID=MMETSP0689_2-20121128/5844_1 /TAXON_ID=160604 /ORGANISM="Amphidinium massartii, Strain CS-259" /LENGTH=847 /DNA_ID=CAMNT_0020001343 /DNA_START=53 /DNA_END=2592 /DNA_ORIENTATION=-